MKVYVPLTSNQGPFANVPVLPDSLRQVSKAWLIRWLEWLKSGNPEVDGYKANTAVAIRCNEFIPALHPRDPETGKFVERPFDIPDGVDSEAFAEMDTPELLQEINDSGGSVDTLLQRDDVTIDGIPLDADSLDDIESERLTGDSLRSEAESILESNKADFEKRNEIEKLVEESTGITSRFDNFTPEQAKEAAAGVAAVQEHQGDLPESLQQIRSSISESTKREVGMPNAAFTETDGMNVVEINPEQFEENEVNQLQDQFLVGEKPRATVIHELSHAIHFQRDVDGTGRGYIDDPAPLGDERKDVIQSEISRYATENVREFVAEAFTYRILGNELPDEKNISNLLDFYIKPSQNE